MDSQRQFEELISQNALMTIKPEFMVKFGIPGDEILLASALKADLIVLGLRRGAHSETASHIPWDVAYKVVSGARCPVLIIRNWKSLRNSGGEKRASRDEVAKVLGAI